MRVFLAILAFCAVGILAERAVFDIDATILRQDEAMCKPQE